MDDVLIGVLVDISDIDSGDVLSRLEMIADGETVDDARTRLAESISEWGLKHNKILKIKNVKPVYRKAI